MVEIIISCLSIGHGNLDTGQIVRGIIDTGYPDLIFKTADDDPTAYLHLKTKGDNG